MRDTMRRVMHMTKSDRESSRAITVRIPESEYMLLRDRAQEYGVSLNTLVADAIAEQTSRIKRQALLDDIADFHRRLGKMTPPTSVDDIREIRLERARRLVPDKPEEGPSR